MNSADAGFIGPTTSITSTFLCGDSWPAANNGGGAHITTVSSTGINQLEYEPAPMVAGPDNVVADRT
jgi:hypothetical protein